ncbi:MAG: hypothetical protein SFX73_38020 [Kofleriaceae bacterium]|nr:hypothetical protein [Kofleriaceae bacterium]
MSAQTGLAEPAIVKLFARFADALDAAVGVLTEPEAHYLAYRRHVECHPRQDGYRLQMVGKQRDQLKDQVPSQVLGRSVSHQDSERMLRTVLLQHGIDESKIGPAIAPRLVEPMRRVLAAAVPLYT